MPQAQHVTQVSSLCIAVTRECTLEDRAAAPTPVVFWGSTHRISVSFKQILGLPNVQYKSGQVVRTERYLVFQLFLVSD